MDWKKLLAYISGSVDEDLLLRNEYLVTENRILRAQIKGNMPRQGHLFLSCLMMRIAPVI